MKTFTIYILFFILYFVTGGGKGGVFKVKYDKIERALTSVEPLVHITRLQMKHHSQTGLEACGGAWHYFCVKFNKGNTILFG